MKRKRFTDAQIMHCLKKSETGTPIKELVREFGISEQTFHRWKRKYSGMCVSEMKKMKQMEDEIRHLKRLVADLSLDKQMLQDVLKKKL